MSIASEINESTEGSIEILKKIYDATQRSIDDLRRDLRRDLDRHFNYFEQRIQKNHNDLENRLEGLENRFEGLETRFTGVEVRLERLETRFDAFEGRFDNLETRFDAFEGRFEGLEAKVVENSEYLEEARGDFLSAIDSIERQPHLNYQNPPKNIYGRRKVSPSRYNLGQSPFFWKR